MGNPTVRADAGRFPHRMAARIACAIGSALFRREEEPSPAAHEGLSPQPGSGASRRLAPGAILLLSGALAACGENPLPGVEPAAARRIVSLDYCADQYLLGLVERDRILAVSPDAGARFSYHREAAAGLSRVRPVAEEVIALAPDLIVRSYGGGPHAAAFFERAGIRVHQLGHAADLAGVRRLVVETAAALGVPENGETLAAQLDAWLDATPDAASATALYLTPGGVTAGPGTLIHEVLVAAGYRNFQRAAGFREIPLERLAHERPDLAVAAFHGDPAAHGGSWSAARHPLARRLLAEGPVVFLDGALVAGEGWFLAEAIAALAAAR